MRRCQEDRWDFTGEDNPAIFPIGVSRSGPFFGFCPGKATWDHGLAETYKILEVSYFTGALPYSGGILDQPDWYMDLLTTFCPLYDQYKFYNQQKAIWGGGSEKKGGSSASHAKQKAGAKPKRKR